MNNLTGKRFGRLVVIERVEDVRYENGAMVTQWKCKCDCGNIVIKRSQGLISGKTRSCGCLRKEIGNKPFLFKVGETINTKHSSFRILDSCRTTRKSSNILDKKYMCECMYCGERQLILENTLRSGIGSCKACSDIHSYPAKFFYWFLKQTGIDFQTEYSPEWLGRRRFDFYFIVKGKEYVVEIDGAQHYTHGHKRLTVEEVKQIDCEKDELAAKNNVQVIRIDCRESKGRLIVNAMENSILPTLFEFDKINWRKCAHMSISNKYKQFCDLWNQGIRSTTEIAQITGFKANYISKCLQECCFYGLCNYNQDFERLRGSYQSTNGKRVHCAEVNLIFESAAECSRRSEEIFGAYLTDKGISKVCRGERKNYKGYHFEYV
nr:MAG TPA: restriction enzyme [Caudoviricetes sp.]